jgi:hypothetical protein
VGVSSEMQWVVYDFPLQETREFEAFRPTPYFMKTYVPFFTQYAQVSRDWTRVKTSTATTSRMPI